MRALFIIAVAVTVAVFLGNTLDFLHNNISWKEARGYIFLSILAALVLLSIFVTARKKETAHR